MLKAYPETYTEILSKDGEIYWSQAFKKISVQILAQVTKQRLQWLHIDEDTEFAELFQKIH